MADSFVIMYELHQNGHVHSQVVAVCDTVELAEQWIKDEPKGKTWASKAKFKGKGTNIQLTTTFDKGNWSCYFIQSHKHIK